MTKVLVVDDSAVMREMVVACLRGLPEADFEHAASGLEAIERLSLSPYDLVVLDLNMPDIGGYEVLEFVRGQDQLREVPILVVTTRGDETSRRRAMDAGASRFMTKPFSPEQIQEEARSLLDGSSAGGASTQGAPAGGTGGAPAGGPGGPAPERPAGGGEAR